ncbi:MAG: DUF4114 domain-containing protein, partial [Pseudomonadota bacterium]
TSLLPEEQSSATPGDTAELIVPPPAAGSEEQIVIEPGALISLNDPAFDPSRARYEVFDTDLVITLENDSVIVLEQFFAGGGEPAQLSLLGSPAVTSVELLSQTDLASRAQAQQIEPAAGPGDTTTTGGGADFEPYSQGSLPPGLDPVGPQPPVLLSFGADFPALEPTIPFDEDDGGILPPLPPSPPVNGAPVVTVWGEVDGTIAETTTGFPFASAEDFPLQGNRKPIDPDNVNNVDQGNLTIPPASEGSDGAREVRVILDGRTNSNFGNTLGYYTIAEDGTIVDPRIVFANENDFSAGDTVNIGTFPPGTEVAFFIVARGGDLNAPDLFDSGTLKFINPETGEPAKITDNAFPFSPDGVPDLIHVDTQGNETAVKGTVYHTADASQSTTDSDRLNPDFKAHAVSGFDPDSGNLVIGMEDQSNQGDRDFDDVVFQVSIGDATGQTVFFADQGGRLNAEIVDLDSEFMSVATVAIVDGAQTGDTLGLPGVVVDPTTGQIQGTNISFASDPLTNSLTFSGIDTIDNYQTVLNAVRVGSTEAVVEPGTRVVEVIVTDSEGASSTPARSEFTIENRLQVGTDGNDILDGDDGIDALSGRGGNDQLRGFGNDDILAGAEGRDALRGGDGDDLLIGGANPDSLSGDAGADTFKYTGLGDARDTILDFNANDGDRLDISDLIDQAETVTGTPITQANLDQFFRLDPVGDDINVIADLDGAGDKFVEVTLARLDNPTGVDGGDIAPIITNPPSDGATS